MFSNLSKTRETCVGTFFVVCLGFSPQISLLHDASLNTIATAVFKPEAILSSESAQSKELVEMCSNNIGALQLRKMLLNMCVCASFTLAFVVHCSASG